MKWAGKRGHLCSFAACTRGAALIEYALLMGVVALALSQVVGVIGGEIHGALHSLASMLREDISAIP